ncbi:hypothetical protein KSF_103910 [Reticulibacter mediterranei]|uniref:Uncharacterized protein n=1 Tax=Reticulibacter mediterranei TaxID=2778369 RepID=A0A8J3N936_9CHLR|nr:hypothetical protein KSF_103910 [Reticulibacter mediterranei]
MIGSIPQDRSLHCDLFSVLTHAFDADLTRIKELLKLGLSVRKIATLLGYTNHHAFNTYITKRQLREQSS